MQLHSIVVKGANVDQLSDELDKQLEILTTSERDGVEPPGKIKIVNVQQFVVGEVDKRTITLNSQPIVNYSFCLLIIYGWE